MPHPYTHFHDFRIDPAGQRIELFPQGPAWRIGGALMLAAGITIFANLVLGRLQLGLLGWGLAPLLVLAGLWLLNSRERVVIETRQQSRSLRRESLLGDSEEALPAVEVTALIVRHVRSAGGLGWLSADHVLYAVEGEQLVPWASRHARQSLEHQATLAGELLGCTVELEPHDPREVLVSLGLKALALLLGAAALAALATFLHLSQAIKLALAWLFNGALFAAGLWLLALGLRHIARRWR